MCGRRGEVLREHLTRVVWVASLESFRGPSGRGPWLSPSRGHGLPEQSSEGVPSLWGSRLRGHLPWSLLGGKGKTTPISPIPSLLRSNVPAAHSPAHRGLRVCRQEMAGGKGCRGPSPKERPWGWRSVGCSRGDAESPRLWVCAVLKSISHGPALLRPVGLGQRRGNRERDHSAVGTPRGL